MRKVTTIFLILIISKIFGQKSAEPFQFEFENKTLRGLIEKPQYKPSNAIVILVPGYGKTNFIEGNWFSTLRDKFVESGFTVCFWDKMGCGNSDGEFNADQPVQNSAEEVITAIQKLKKQDNFKSMKIGLWGISRAGWICPLVIEKQPIDFWISVSGTDEYENFGYLLKSNLLINGKSQKDAQYLYEAWMKGHEVYCTGGTFDTYIKAITPLKNDALCQKLFGYTNETEIIKARKNEYIASQKTYTKFGFFDENSGLWTYIPNFQQTLKNVNCPVLAIFGENDSQVDWRKTKALYEQTINKNSKGELTIKTFFQCNHSIQKCKTCGYMEDLQEYKWQACDGYYETMFDWLKSITILD